VDAASEIVEEANAAIDRLVAACGLFPNRQSSLLKSPTANRSMRSSAARAWRADLIVLGAKGVASLGSIILGGTAEHVMKEAPCSVLTVRHR
jgi:nucleotide-binding universal stress UspA family protein